MKKIKLYNLALLFALGGVFTSCNDDDDATKERSVKPVISVVQNNFTVTEGEIVTINLTTDMPFKEAMGLKLELVGGTGSFKDYVCSGDETTLDDGFGVIGHKLSFPAYSTSASFDITPVLDYLIEGTETLEFRLYGMGNSAGIVADETITITVNNGTSDDVHVVVDWSQSFTNSHGNVEPGEYLGADGNGHEYCDYDFDLEIFDGSFNYFDVSYESCPEMVIIPSSAPDDFYFIVPSFWTNAGTAAPASRINFKVKVTVAKPGVWVNEMNIDDVWNSVQGGEVQGFPDAYILSHVLIKTGTTYVLEDENGNELASGRNSRVNRIPKKLSK